MRFIIGPIGCVSGDTEFLTPDGWRRIDQWREGDQALVLDERGKSWFELVGHVDQPAEDLLQFRSRRGPSMVLSFDHRVCYRSRSDVSILRWTTAQDLMTRLATGGAQEFRVPRLFTAPDRLGLGVPEQTLRLMVAIAADGSPHRNAGKLIFNLKKPRKIDRLLGLLDGTGKLVSVHPRKDGATTLYMYGHKLPLDDPWWWGASAAELKIIIDEVAYWDGHRRNNGVVMFGTTLKGGADFIQYAAATCGVQAGIEKHPTQWVVALSNGVRDQSGANVKACKVTVVPAENGRQYCLRTSTGVWLARHRDKVFWTGNSGKTTGMIMECLRRSAQQAPGPDGVRRTRIAIVRNTLKQLMSTVLPDVMSVLNSFGPIARFHVTTSCVRIRVGDISSDWYLMPLETIHDTRRLLSMTLTWAWVAEFREINYEILSHLLGRCGRYPNLKHGGILPTWWGLFGESNPFNIDSLWNLHLLEKRPPTWSFYRQPGGRSAEAEHKGLVPGYYENLVAGADPDWVKVHVDAEIGESLEGRGVWRGLFDRSFHVTSAPIQVMPGIPLIFSFDFGRTPACLLSQLDPRGRIVVIHEWTSEDMGLDQFVDMKIKPWMNMNNLWGMARMVTADPSGAHEAQATNLSCFDVLKERGFLVRPADTNEIWPRLYAVEKRLLMRMGILIGAGCGTLVRALAGEYRFRRKRTGDYEDLPEKKHPVSDVADCLQYLCMLIDGRGYPRAMQAINGTRKVSAGLNAWV